MTQFTIPAQVVNGHLQHERSLPEFEGQRVIATLTVVADDSKNCESEKTAPQKLSADFDPEPPPWLEVEHDLYFIVSQSNTRINGGSRWRAVNSE